MKKQKRLLSLVSAALALLLVLGALPACGGKANEVDAIGSRPISFDKVYKSPEEIEWNSGYTKAEEIARLKDKTVTVCGSLLRFTENQQYCFYSVEENRVVLALDQRAVDDVEVVGDYLRIVSTEGGKQRTAVYGMNGKQYAEVDGQESVVATDEGFTVAERFYRIEDGERRGLFAIPPFVAQSDMGFIENYYYLKGVSGVTLYDEEQKAVLSYAYPRNCSSAKLFKLCGNTMLLQYTMRCPEESTDYDYINGDVKYTVHHVLLNAESGKARELALGVLVDKVILPEDTVGGDFALEDIFTDRVPQIISYHPVVNGFLASPLRYAILEEGGKVGAMLDEYVDGQRGLILPLNSTEFSAVTDCGTAILDAEGKVTATLPRIGEAKEYGYYDEVEYPTVRLYDKEFKLKLTIEWRSILWNTPTALLYESDGALRIYDKNGDRVIVSAWGDSNRRLLLPDSEIYDYFIIVEFIAPEGHSYGKDQRYTLYKPNGEVLYERAETPGSSSAYLYSYDPIVTGEDSAVFKDIVDGKTVYIRLSR